MASSSAGELTRKAALARLSAWAAASKGEASAASAFDVSSLFDLAGETAILTDAGGYGTKDVARLLAAAGAFVVLADRAHDKAQALAAEIVEAGFQAVALDTDIENEDSVVALFADVAKDAGGIDILVNCAGMLGNQPLAETTLQQWDDIQSLNLRANFLCMREAVRRMVDAGRGGRIVNITTIGAVHPVMNGNAAYGSARQGVSALARDTALDYASHGIRVNNVLVGAVKDKTSTHHTTVEAQESGQRRPTGPLIGPGRLPFGYGTMRDVGAAVLYLVSPAGQYVTGHELVLDGGFLVS